MTILLQKTYARTLYALIQRFSTATDRGMRIEAWLFDDQTDRHKAEAELAALGIQARLRSAYKPLLHTFLEDIDIQAESLSEIRVLYPVCSQTTENRFLLETYPLAALVGDIRISFTPGRREECVYDVILINAKGQESRHQVFAPNRDHQDSIGEKNLSPTGWLRVYDDSGALLVDEGLETDFETVFAETLRTVAGHPWGETEPFFKELNITVHLPGRDQPLDYDQEVLSLHEALHEDLYFSLLEFFQYRAHRPPGDRSLQPGQIVPEILQGAAEPQVRIEIRPLDDSEIHGPNLELAIAESPISAGQIQAELGQIDGTLFTATSRAGRIIEARYHRGSDFPVMISGGQHANETSGVVGALRAARLLAARNGAHFTLAPLENPDGYALHQRLIRDNPNHMHHAARYTALGDDLGHRTSNLFEAKIRTKARQLSQAGLHINLHGYPSHEWTRPLSGYVPSGFAMWTLPKGFFLIMNHQPAWAQRAQHFLALFTEKLAAVPGLLTFTTKQMDLYHIHSGGSDFPVIGGFPCMITASEDQETPLVLTSEYPDETCHGPAFIAAHEAQMATVLAAYEAYQQLMLQALHNGGDTP